MPSFTFEEAQPQSKTFSFEDAVIPPAEELPENGKGDARQISGSHYVASLLGKGLHQAGSDIYDSAAAAALAATGQGQEAMKQLGHVTDESGRTPIEQGIQQQSTPGRILSSGTKGLIETTPQIAAVAGGQALGIPAPISAGAVFGLTPEGFSPKQAIIGAALPEIGKWTGDLAELLASKLKITSEAANAAINKVGGAFGAAAVIGADQLHEISQLPPDKRKDAFLDAAGNVGSMFWLGLLGGHGDDGKPNAAALLREGRGMDEASKAQANQSALLNTFRENPQVTPENAADRLRGLADQNLTPKPAIAPTTDATVKAGTLNPGEKIDLVDKRPEAAAPAQSAPANDIASNIEKMTAIPTDEFIKGVSQGKGLTRNAYELGMQIETPDELKALVNASELADKQTVELKNKMKADKAAGIPGSMEDFQKWSNLTSRGQFFREAVEAAKGFSKDPRTLAEYPDFKPKFDKDGNLIAKKPTPAAQPPIVDQTVKNEPVKAGEPNPDEARHAVEPKAHIEDKPQAPQRFRLGKSPQTYTLEEKLPATQVEIDNGEQPVRVKNEKTGESQVVLESELQKVNTVSKEDKPVSNKSSLDEQIKSGGLDPSMFKTVAQKKDAIKRIEAKKQFQSLGGQNPNDPLEIPKSNLAQLTDAVASLKPAEGRPKLKDAFNIGSVIGKLKDAKQAALNGLNSAWEYAKLRLNGRPEVTDWKRALGDKQLADAESKINAQKFKEMHERNTTPLLREAISNYLDTGGDFDKLQDGLDNAPDQYKEGYRRALNLTKEERVLAENIKNYFESRLEDAQKAGILEDGIENYIHRMYEKDSTWKSGAISELRSGLFTGKPALAKKRVFETDLDAERAGYKPVKDYVKRVVAYDLSLNKAIADRQFVKDVMQQTMPDGRPRFDIAGRGERTEDDQGNTKATFIEPRWKPNDDSKPNFRGDYKTYDHPAFRKWKWVEKDENGKPIFVKGNVLVHPDAYKSVKSLLDRSAIADSKVGNLALRGGSTIKQTMLDLSGFHPVQIGIHAMEHRTFAPVKEIDFTNPDVRGLIKGGLTVGETSGRSMFDEGLKGSSLLHDIPGIGPKLQAYNHWLFESYIPRLKVATGLHALERNRAAYPKLSDEELHAMTASQMNNAFGGLNYEMMGRSKTMQDALRIALLAPDFLEARARFAGQAATAHGSEQLKALLVGAAAMYVTARIMNKLDSDDYHWEPKNAFNFVHNGKAYGLRTVQGDLIHLASDPVGFLRNRLNPAITKPMLEAFTGRNQFGVKRSPLEQAKDEAATAIPISLKGFFSGKEQSVMEAFLNSMGVTEHRDNASNDIYDKVEAWKKANKVRQEPGEFIYDKDKDPYRPIKNAAQFYDVSDVKSEVAKAIKSGETKEQIQKHFNRYANAPLTGSRANDDKFVKSLSDSEKKTLEKSKQEKAAVLQKVNAALKDIK